MGINTFTTQEALNFDSYNEWNYEELDVGTALAGYKSSSYIKANNPAKKVVIYPVPGQTVAANDNLYIYLNDTITQYFQTDGSTPNLVDDADFNSSEATFVVDDGDTFTVGDVVLIDAELMYVSSITDETITVTRGYGQTIGAAHANNSIMWKVGLPGKHSASASSRPLIRVDTDQLPFTLSGVMISNLYVLNSGAAGDTDDDVSVLSFH